MDKLKLKSQFKWKDHKKLNLNEIIYGQMSLEMNANLMQVKHIG
jgi:hypothetical protein